MKTTENQKNSGVVKMLSFPVCGLQVVRGTKQLLQLCAHAEKAVNADELYKAFKLLEQAHTEFLQPDTDQWVSCAAASSHIHHLFCDPPKSCLPRDFSPPDAVCCELCGSIYVNDEPI